MGGDIKDPDFNVIDVVISIHTSVWEVTKSNIGNYYTSDHFNPHLRMGGDYYIK